MRDYRIEITQFEFLSIFSLTIDKEINNHACAVVAGLISDDNAANYRDKLMQDVWVQISAVDEKDRSSNIMTGIVAGFTLDCISQQKTLTLKIMSGTWLMDGCPHFRTFQNDALTYAKVMETIDEGYTDSDYMGIDAINMPVGGMLLQYMETDWAFLKRISSHFGSYVTPSTSLTGVKYYVGRNTKSVFNAPAGTPYTATKRVGEFMRNSSSGLGSFSERDYLEYQFQSRDIYNLWDQISLDKYTGYVYKIHGEYIGSELVHTYFLRSEQGMACIPAFNLQQIGCSFEAIVKEVKQDVVRIEVIDDENEKQKDTVWFPYSTVYSTPDGPGWYCMPEVDDQVRLYVPNERERQAYVISAVHKGDSPDRQNPDYKSIKTVYDKELLMTPEFIRLTNNKGMSIEISDAEGIKIISDKDIQIKAADNVTVTSDDASVMVAGTNSVNMTQGGASINLDDDVAFTGAKFRIQ